MAAARAPVMQLVAAIKNLQRRRLFKPLLWVGADHDTEQSNRHAANAAVGVELGTVANGMAE
jgi:hypothetical protein